MVMGPSGPTTPFKPRGVLDRVALHLLYCLQFIFPSLKGDYYVVALMLAYILALPGFCPSAMLTILLCCAILNLKLSRFLSKYNRPWPILDYPLKLRNARCYMCNLHKNLRGLLLFHLRVQMLKQFLSNWLPHSVY